ncbi:unnamed protein product [Anisakis simplex]|uniref:Transmembrane protein 180 n=1 Tax=Anisakis simplex TaxID=6269 RepID=A0A0M3JWR7_ANISI|nr:unnamed protein product [Anisakis simplex]
MVKYYFKDLSDSWMRNRRKVIVYLSPFLCASFLLLWFPWTNHTSHSFLTGLHLIVALFLYDAFYSCINVAWGALFAESTHDPITRVTAIKYSQFAILMSVNIISITEKLSHSLEETDGIMIERAALVPNDEHAKIRSALSMALQVLKRLDFVVLVLTNFLHNCRSVSHLNFAAMAVKVLIPEETLPNGSWSKSFFFGACTVLPQVLIIGSGSFISKRGVYRVIMTSFILSIVSAIIFSIFAGNRPLLVMLFMFFDSVLVHSIAPLFQILIAEFVDDDAKRLSRSKPISSLIFSLNALLVKPAQSITPVIVLFILGERYTNALQAYDSAKFEEMEHEKTTMWSIVCSTPLLLATAQCFILRFYSLKNAHLSTRLSRNI